MTEVTLVIDSSRHERPIEKAPGGITDFKGFFVEPNLRLNLL